MDLKQYLEKQGLSISKFAKMFDLPEITVTKYKYGDRIPNKLNMKKIYAVTDKEVTPNDFYKIKKKY